MTASSIRRLAGRFLLLVAAAVCSAQTFNPPSPVPSPPSAVSPIPSGAAKAVSVIGQVSILRDSYPWALRVGDVVKMQQVVITGPDGFAVFELSDGSSFQVFPGSRLTFRNNPSDWTDLLDLWIGRVKVFIQKLGNQPNPNRIFTPTAVISVRGTVFDVVIEDGDDTTLVAVDEGQVVVRHRLLGGSKLKTVNAGEYIRVYKDAPIARSFDKGAATQKGLRAAMDALYTILMRSGSAGPTGPGPGPTSTGGGPTLPGDTGGTAPPPPPDAGSAPAPPPSGPPPPPPGD